jgi:hypothetical protein
VIDSVRSLRAFWPLTGLALLLQPGFIVASAQSAPAGQTAPAAQTAPQSAPAIAPAPSTIPAGSGQLTPVTPQAPATGAPVSDEPITTIKVQANEVNQIFTVTDKKG